MQVSASNISISIRNEVVGNTAVERGTSALLSGTRIADGRLQLRYMAPHASHQAIHEHGPLLRDETYCSSFRYRQADMGHRDAWAGGRGSSINRPGLTGPIRTCFRDEIATCLHRRGCALLEAL
nr:hypothetical protein CFP56_00535 [Quercus suber]